MITDASGVADIRDAVAALPDPPSEFACDAAVVTVANPPYHPGCYVLGRMLRHVGCALPFHVWHWRADAPAPYLRAIPGVTFRHLDDLPGVAPATHLEVLRTLLFLHGGAARPFWVGCDAYPVADLTPCWDDLGCGSLFWREVPAGDKFIPANYGLDESARKATFQPQGDTVLVDLRRPEVYRAVALTHWFNERRDRFDRHMEAHGDQTQFRAAWALLGLKQGCYRDECVDWTTFPCVYVHWGRDRPLVVHRVGSKWPGAVEFNQPLVFHPGLPLEVTAWRYYFEAA